MSLPEIAHGVSEEVTQVLLVIQIGNILIPLLGNGRRRSSNVYLQCARRASSCPLSCFDGIIKVLVEDHVNAVTPSDALPVHQT